MVFELHQLFSSLIREKNVMQIHYRETVVATT